MILTYANQLTILRMIFIPCFVLLVVYERPVAAMLIFVLAGITDALDGLLARKLQQKTVLGAYLDPMADKLLIAAGLITLTIPSVPVAVHIPAWLTITAFSRDFLIALAVLIIHLQTHHSRFPPSFLGKLTTTALLVTIGVALLGNIAREPVLAVFPFVVYAALFLTVVSGLHYFYLSVKIIESYQKTGVEDGEDGSQNPGSGEGIPGPKAGTGAGG